MIRRLFVVLLLATAAAPAGDPLRFRIVVDPGVTSGTLSGRLFVILSNKQEKADRLSTGFSPGATWLAAMEVDGLKPGEAFVFNPDLKAYPRPFSAAAKGTYQFMALLDPDHTYAYHGQDEGDLYGPVVQVADLNPADTAPVQLVLNKRTEARVKVEDTENIKLVELESPLLSAFWGRPIIMRAGVVLPPGYAADNSQRYPVCYRVHGFGGNHTAAWTSGRLLPQRMAEGKQAAMIQVYLDGSFSTGHHVFADSVNNGPWGTALTRELIPYLDQRFRTVPEPYARFLTGHSSGGWTTLWLQVSYPDVFGGTWSTAPDPVDFRSFTGIDSRYGSKDNAYRNADGTAKNLVRRKGQRLASFEEFVRQEEVAGEYGGQIASFEWVFSPRGEDGRPMKLFSRATGEQNPVVQKAWEKYDIRLVLERNWATLGPKLRGKLHIVCGTEDTFHLEEAVTYLCDYLKSKGREDACEMVPGRDHGDLYRPYKTYADGLGQRIDQEMWAAFEKALPTQ
jgi:S-formylglutathione hydrolase FrmB